MALEKITKTIYRPCRGLSIKHVINLGSKAKNGNRKSDTWASNYKSNKYNNASDLTSLFLDTQDYMVFSISNDVEVYVSYPHLYRVKKAFKKALKWFSASVEIFTEVDDDLIVHTKYKKLNASALGLVGNRNIVIRPSVVDDGDYVYEGVAITLHEPDNVIYMTVDELEAFWDFLSTFNLYMSSQMMLNFAKLYEIKNQTRQTKQYKPKKIVED